MSVLPAAAALLSAVEEIMPRRENPLAATTPKIMDGQGDGYPTLTKRPSTTSTRKRRWGPRKQQQEEGQPHSHRHHRSPPLNHHHQGGGRGGGLSPRHEQKIVKQAVEPIHHEDDLSLKRFKKFRRGRSSSTCRQQHPTFERRHKGTWRCLVCYLWNDMERYQCSRCGAQEGVDKEVATRSVERDRLAHQKRAGSRSRSFAPRSILRSSSYCSAIRQSTDHDEEEELKHHVHEGSWPPVFESNGGAYVFDSRSEMFWESSSDFFYDPKSKLYFGNKKRAYFRYVSGSNSFIQVTDSFPDDANATTTTGQQGKKAGKKTKSITIKIKSDTTKPLKRPRSSSCGALASSHVAAGSDRTSIPLDHRTKDQLANIKKWEEQQRAEVGKTRSATATEPGRLTRDMLSHSLERAREACASAERSLSQQRDLTLTGRRNEHSSAPSSSQPSRADATKRSATPKTVSGNPICLLCKRKFASIEKLKFHEQHSALHKTNLMMKARDSEESAAAAMVPQQQPVDGLSQPSSVAAPAHRTKRPSTSTNYIDRAKRRRALFGENLSTPAGPTKPVSLSLTEQPVRTIPLDPTKLLGEGNVGHQLFQKMVAKSTTPVEPPSSNSGLTGSLRKDWERIEAMSKGGGGGAPGIG